MASFRKGDLLTRTTRLVKGLAKTEPTWLKAMQQLPDRGRPIPIRAPPANFPRAEGKVKKIVLPEDVYVKQLYKKYIGAISDNPIKISSFDHPPARIYGLRVLELKEQGVDEEEAMAVADMEYRAERKARKKAYARLKEVTRLQGKTPPPNPYPNVVKEFQDEEKPYVRARFNDPEIIEIAERMKEERRILESEGMVESGYI